MRFAFVCDAGAREGSGHVARCLSVAEVLRRDAHTVAWFADIAAIPWVGDEIARVRDPLIVPADDPSQLEQQVLDWGPAAAVVDSYLLPPSFGARLAESGTAVVSISDPATPDRPADLRWSPGFGTGTSATHPPSVEGPECVLIRAEFSSMRDQIAPGSLRRSNDSWEVGVLMGGTPEPSLVRSVVGALDAVPVPLRIHVNTRTPLGGRRKAVIEHGLGPEYWQVLRACDLVVSAAGVSAWELLHVGIPAGLILTADNQAQNYWGMAARGWTLSLGTAQQAHDEPGYLASGVTDALLSWPVTQERADAARGGVDGLGALRLARALINLGTSA